MGGSSAPGGHQGGPEVPRLIHPGSETSGEGPSVPCGLGGVRCGGEMLGSSGGRVRSFPAARVPPSPSGSPCASSSGSSPRPVSMHCWSCVSGVGEGYCHDFCRSRCISLFGRCSGVDVNGLLAIIDPVFIFHWFSLVFLHTWFQSHALPVVYLTLCFPSCPCQRLFVVHDRVCIGARRVLVPTLL